MAWSANKMRQWKVTTPPVIYRPYPCYWNSLVLFLSHQGVILFNIIFISGQNDRTAFFEEMAEQILDFFGSKANWKLSSGLHVLRFFGGTPQLFKILAPRGQPSLKTTPLLSQCWSLMHCKHMCALLMFCGWGGGHGIYNFIKILGTRGWSSTIIKNWIST